MIKNLFKKWYCSHKWETHAKEPLVFNPDMHFVEILICEHCGKIKKILY